MILVIRSLVPYQRLVSLSKINVFETYDVTPCPDEVHSTCNYRGTYVH